MTLKLEGGLKSIKPTSSLHEEAHKKNFFQEDLDTLPTTVLRFINCLLLRTLLLMVLRRFYRQTFTLCLRNLTE